MSTTKRLMSIIACLALVGFLAGFLTGCPRPIEPGKPASLIDCTAQAVRSRAIPLIPKVNDCLVQPSEWQKCLIGLIDPVAGITEDALACTVQHNHGTAAAASSANPSDSLSRTRAERSQSFIKDRGYTFKHDESRKT